MRRLLILPMAVILASGAAALAPITVHAQFGTSGGKCPNGLQSIGTGLGTAHHAFSDSHNNCVDFEGTNDSAFFEDSNNNLGQIFGTHNSVDEFVNSSNNLFSFDTGNGGGSTLSATGSNSNTVEFFNTSANDVLTMIGTQDVGIGIQGTGDFLMTGSSCAPGTLIFFTDSNKGTAGDPIVLC